MIEINNYLQRHYLEDGGYRRLAREDDFFNVSDVELLDENKAWFSSGPLMYIPGAILMNINNVPILTFEDWDFPYWQYGELVAQIDDLMVGNVFSIQFLLTNSSLRIKPKTKGVCTVEHVVQGDVKAKSSCERKEFILNFANAAKQMFMISNQYGKNCENDIKTLDDCLIKWQNRRY